jgi:cytochrome c biogenesis protein CcmG, thiol:disulfide interchange protein DsbE
MARAVKARAKRNAAGDHGFRLLLLLVVLGAAALWFGRRNSGPESGSLAPDFALPLVAGGAGTFRLTEARGSPVMVEVFASWCGVCRRSAPTVSAAARARRQREVRFIGVSVDQSANEARSAASEWHLPYDVALDDGHFAKSWGISVLPTFVLIDADGRVRHVSQGAVSEHTLESWLADVGAARI